MKLKNLGITLFAFLALVLSACSNKDNGGNQGVNVGTGGGAATNQLGTVQGQWSISRIDVYNSQMSLVQNISVPLFDENNQQYGLKFVIGTTGMDLRRVYSNPSREVTLSTFQISSGCNSTQTTAIQGSCLKVLYNNQVVGSVLQNVNSVQIDILYVDVEGSFLYRYFGNK